MKLGSIRTVALVISTAALLAACGGGGGGGDSGAVTPPPAAQTVAQALESAAASAANDTSTNSSASFSVLQANGVPAVSVNSAPKVNFAVFSDGKVVKDIKIANASFAIAKLVPGTDGNPDQWVSYVYRTEVPVAGKGPNGTPVLASAKQATTDPKQTDAALLAQQLVLNADGYYTYTFRTDITDPNWTATVSNVAYSTNAVKYEPSRTHRIAIQLAYLNAAGETVRVNPYFDFTIDSAGKAVAVTDPAKTRIMADINSCNSCHDKLAMHGGGRVDVQYCVMCHNQGTTDANSGNVLTMSTMTHKIHAGRLLHSKLAAGGETYQIWGYNSTPFDFSEVGFPQDLRNCTKCHTGANPATPQGDNWKTKVSKDACLTCHANNAGSTWDTTHAVYAGTLVGSGAAAKSMTNGQCASCHKVGSNIAPERVHWNQNEENSAKYKVNIESATWDSATRKVTVKYFVSDPTASDAAYNLVTSDCTGTPATCSNQTRFGNLRLYLAYQSMVGQQQGMTEFTSYNNGGNGANVYMYTGANDGSNHYTATISVPADSTTSVAFGTARVVSIGQVKEAKLEAKSATDPRPEVQPRTLVNVVVQNTFKDVPLTGSLLARREVVSNDKCNVCHGSLGTTSGSNTLAEAFHSGARNKIEACQVCHDANRSSSTVMTNGLALNESYQFKRMIHGIHGNKKRTYPFTYGNRVQGVFDDTGKLTTAGTFLADYSTTINGTTTLVITAGTAVAAGNTFATISDLITQAAQAKGYTSSTKLAVVENYAAEVAYPDLVGINCNGCHVNNSYKQDFSPLASVVKKPSGVTDPNQWLVISPKAATCTACHDSPTAIGHVTSFGGSVFGDKTQAQVGAMPRETCNDCHASGGFKGVDIVHGQK
ncbi:MAG: OmcA/MtrC family decaheme c-type cytochrome [Burkholderiales bacterium]|nr:OmcA/MtrC family decaheme c-type cytochrome [Burkholderiales bacterium]